MALTYVAIATVTVGSGGAANIEFTSIPGTYTDLVMFLSARTDRANYQDYIKLFFNASTTSRTNCSLFANNETVESSSNSDMRLGRADAASSTANTFGNCILYIPNYAGSNNKSSSSDGVSETNGTQAALAFDANLWSNTAAITSIKVEPGDGTNFVQYSTATLYGIKNTV